MRRSVSLGLGGLVLALPLANLLVPPAAAQAVEEIVVTARQREEKLQDVPLTVSAFSGEDLARANAVNFQDIARKTPGVQFDQTLAGTRPGRLYSNIRIRGIAGNEFSTSTSETASLFIDGVYSLQGASTQSLMDVERIEVIQGPQSSLFSRKSFAGAINYITKTPSTSEYITKIDADAGTHAQSDIKASEEGPIVQDKLGFRVSGRFFHHGAQYTATDGGRLGEQQTESIAGDLYATPTDRITLRGRFSYQHDDDGPAATVFLPGRQFDTCTGTSRPGLDAAGNPVTLHPTSMICGQIPNPGQLGAPRVSYGTSIIPPLLAGGPNANFVINNIVNKPAIPGVPYLDHFGDVRNMLRASLTGTYKFDDGTSITATGGYNFNHTADIRSFDYTDVEDWISTIPMKGSDYSADLRVTSPGNQRFRWLIGGSYYNQTYTNSLTGGNAVTVCFLVCSNGPAFFALPLDGTDNSETYGVYGSVSYDILTNLSIDLEARFQRDKHAANNIAQSFNQFLPRVSLTYKATDSLTLYTTLAQSKLPGAINLNIIGCSSQAFTVPFIDPRTGLPSTHSPCQQYQDAVGSAAIPFTKQQKLNAIEAGVKTSLMDNRLTVNLAGYYEKWVNDPFSTFVTVYLPSATNPSVPNATPNFLAVSNSGSTKTYGLEWTTAATLSKAWTMDFGGQWNVNKYIAFQSNNTAQTTAAGTANVAGNRVNGFPEWSLNASSTYRMPLNGTWEGYVRGDLYWQGRVFTGTSNLSYISPYALVNAHIGIEKERIRFEIYVKNLMDQKNWASAAEYTDFSIPGNFNFNKDGNLLVPQDRRTFGIHTTVQF